MTDLLALACSRTWAEVDLDAVAHNVRTLRGRLPDGVGFMAVVKADAYGHGAVPVAREAEAAGADWFGVATADEALELRAGGVGGRVLILGPTPAGRIRDAAAAGCSLTVGGAADLDAIAAAAGPEPVPVHLKVDTGMTRLGVAPEDLADLLGAAARVPVRVEGVFTHLACADDPDDAFTAAQLARFERAVALVRRRHPSAVAHAGASAAILGHPAAAHSLVRAGISLYGVAPAAHLEAAPRLRPMMTLLARVARVRRVPAGTAVSYGATFRARGATTIATVPIGYGDGYPRALSNRGVMLAGGRRLPVAGRVCMDFTMLDAGDVPLAVGDPVVVFGPGLPADEVAAAADTIAYELFCRIGRRVPRVYLRAGRPVAIAAGGALRLLEAGTGHPAGASPLSALEGGGPFTGAGGRRPA